MYSEVNPTRLQLSSSRFCGEDPVRNAEEMEKAQRDGEVSSEPTSGPRSLHLRVVSLFCLVLLTMLFCGNFMQS